jgi:hypothetical protein
MARYFRGLYLAWVYNWQRWICFIKQRTLAWGSSDPPGGPDFDTVANPWLDPHIRRGQLGSLYPNSWYIMEGDSPSFMNLIDNGLGAYRSPAWGGWGGRYTLYQPDGASRPVWTNSNDTAAGTDGEPVTSNQATVWRWRNDYQQDFASRIQWTLTGNYSEADHPPIVIVNDNRSVRPLRIAVIPGQEIHLDTSASYDPDGQAISFHYWQYREAGSTAAEIGIADETDNGATIVVPPVATEGDAHLIVEARDSGGLVQYVRVVLAIGQGSINVPLTSGSR